MSNGNRGKDSEKIFEKSVLIPRCQSALEVYRKMADAYEGSKREVAADFEWLRNGKLHLVEVKSLALIHRLPYPNFPPEQVARLRRWRDAGAVCWVAVHHTKLTGHAWRKIPAEFFYTRDTKRPTGSWNLEQFPLISLQDWDLI